MNDSRSGRAKVTVSADGKRQVRWHDPGSHEVTHMLQHDFPDAKQHLYAPTACNADMALYSGELSYPEGRHVESALVRWRWHPRPAIEIQGRRQSSPDDLKAIFEDQQSVWMDIPVAVVDFPAGSIPSPPAEIADPDAGGADYSFAGYLQQQLGDSSRPLDRVSFLVPNGWNGSDGGGICDPQELTRAWRGRTEATGDGWIVTIDQCVEMTDAENWRELQSCAGYRFTHIGSLSRADHSTFTGIAAFHALERTKLGLELALGRRTGCVLPVGWYNNEPVWCRWRSGQIDGYRPLTSGIHWLDTTIVHEQIANVLSLVLDFTADNANFEALRTARTYYVASNVDVDVQLSVSIPVSALQLLSYYRFVSQRGKYSRKKWNDMATETQVRLLLDEIETDVSIRPYFKHLDAASKRLAASSGNTKDALGVVVKMRNVVTHPTRDIPADFSPYEWAEAGMHARYWLCLALLNTIGYDSDIAEIMQKGPPWTGQLRKPPWVHRAGNSTP